MKKSLIVIIVLALVLSTSPKVKAEDDASLTLKVRFNAPSTTATPRVLSLPAASGKQPIKQTAPVYQRIGSPKVLINQVPTKKLITPPVSIADFTTQRCDSGIRVQISGDFGKMSDDSRVVLSGPDGITDVDIDKWDESSIEVILPRGLEPGEYKITVFNSNSDSIEIEIPCEGGEIK